jgi:hypothetical protein
MAVPKNQGDERMRVLRSISAGPIAVLFAVMTPAVAATAAEKPQSGAPRSVEELLGPQHGASSQLEPQPAHVPFHTDSPADRLRHWNTISIDASGLDHTPVREGETRVFGEQVGPGRSSRAIAIVHIAMADAVASIRGGFRRYSNIPNAPAGASIHTAISTAAAETLIAMFPSQRQKFAMLLAEDLIDAPGTVQQKVNGILAGHRAAAAILARSANDGSNHPEPLLGIGYIPGLEPGEWRQDPISRSPVALGAHWGEVRPFVLASASQFRVPPFPPMTSAQYTASFNEVKRLGGDGVVTPTERTADQTHVGIYWAYDGTPSLCAPPRLYNQIARKISENSDDVVALARLFALVNVAMADSGIAIWESKFFYKIWRPVGGIREADEGTGPSGDGDSNPNTAGDVDFSPLGAPASNLTGPNFTPPFPAYPSGHAGFGGALFQVLRRFYGRDNVAFTFTSDEFNGETRGNDGEIRPLLPRSFTSFSQAEEENGQSRIYLGIHWSFDKTEGIAQGRKVANYVFDHAFQRTR